MKRTWRRHITIIVMALAALAALAWLLRPRPIPVDFAMIERGEITVTVDQEGVTRIRDIYRVSSPIAGHLARSALEPGDRIEQGAMVAAIHPADPPFLDARSRREIDAAIESARAAVAAARADAARVRAQLDFAQANRARIETLAGQGTVSARALDEARFEETALRAQLAAAQASLEARERERDSIQARRLQPGENLTETAAGECCVKVAAPASGVVLRVLVESEQVVAAGEPLLEIGDPRNLEIVVDLLSLDAVRVQPGMTARIADWGGDGELTARVRQIDPAGFTKVSALGIEEQRVNAVLDLLAPPERWQRLGHDFRVFARIEVWRGEDVLRVPLGALFRAGADWAVFREQNSRAVLIRVRIGERNDFYAEVLAGLAAGERVVLHPGDLISDGVAITARAE